MSIVNYKNRKTYTERARDRMRNIRVCADGIFDQQKRRLDPESPLQLIHTLVSDIKTRLIYIFGEAGSGKTTLIRSIYEHYNNGTEYAIHITSTSAISAQNIKSTPNAETIHARLGLGYTYHHILISNRYNTTVTANELWRTISTQTHKFRKAYLFLTTTDVLIIDEISMLNIHLWRVLDQLFRLATNHSMTPFGTLNTLIVSGDFSQLPPVSEPCQYTNGHGRDRRRLMVFETEIWSLMHPTNIVLDRNFRQQLDIKFQTILKDIRTGSLKPSTIKFLLDLTVPSEDVPEDTLRILPFKKDVHTYNITMMKRLPQYRIIPPRLKFKGHFPLKQQHYWLSRLENIFPLKNCHVAVGAKILLCNNVLRSQGLVNGSFGTIRGIHSDYLTCEFDDLPDQQVYVTRHTFQHFTGYMQCVIHLVQFPILPAWALTVHKVQGLTIEADVAIQVHSSFEYGQVYTAMSRVTHSRQIRIILPPIKGQTKKTDSAIYQTHLSQWIKVFDPAQEYESDIMQTLH